MRAIQVVTHKTVEIKVFCNFFACCRQDPDSNMGGEAQKLTDPDLEYYNMDPYQGSQVNTVRTACDKTRMVSKACTTILTPWLH